LIAFLALHDLLQERGSEVDHQDDGRRDHPIVLHLADAIEIITMVMPLGRLEEEVVERGVLLLSD
jgi:hypothetical protein